LIDPFRPKVKGWVDRSKGKVGAVAAHDELVMLGSTGWERTMWRVGNLCSQLTEHKAVPDAQPVAVRSTCSRLWSTCSRPRLRPPVPGVPRHVVQDHPVTPGRDRVTTIAPWQDPKVTALDRKNCHIACHPPLGAVK
jgi:hypothetical protein